MMFFEGSRSRGVFCWRGKAYRLGPALLRLLIALWNAPGRSLYVEDAAHAVWDVRPSATHTCVPTLRVYATRIGLALMGTGIEVHVQRDRRDGRQRIFLVTP